MRRSTLAAGLKAAAGQGAPQAITEQPSKATTGKGPATVLIGGHFAPEVRRTLLLVQAEPQNTGKNLKQLLGEAINDLCAKYGKPQPYSGED
jgi:hypothetical protein